MDGARLQKSGMDGSLRVYDDTVRPGVQAFRFAVRGAGLQISEAEAKAFVASQAKLLKFKGNYLTKFSISRFH